MFTLNTCGTITFTWFGSKTSASTFPTKFLTIALLPYKPNGAVGGIAILKGIGDEISPGFNVTATSNSLET